MTKPILNIAKAICIVGLMASNSSSTSAQNIYKEYKQTNHIQEELAYTNQENFKAADHYNNKPTTPLESLTPIILNPQETQYNLNQPQVLSTAPSVKQMNNKTDHRNKVLAGFKIGTNYSNVYDAQGDAFNSDAKFGFVGGGFISIPLGTYLGIQPEFLFSQKGFRATGNVLGGGYSLTRTTDYIDIPLLVSIKPTRFITVLLGPQYSYLLRQKDVFSSGTTTIAQEQEFKNENIRKNMLCVTGGADFTMDQLVVGTRLGWDFQKNNGDGSSTTPRYKNVWFQITLGYIL
jgi:hypothetical protein